MERFETCNLLWLLSWSWSRSWNWNWKRKLDSASDHGDHHHCVHSPQHSLSSHAPQSHLTQNLRDDSPTPCSPCRLSLTNSKKNNNKKFTNYCHMYKQNSLYTKNNHVTHHKSTFLRIFPSPFLLLPSYFHLFIFYFFIKLQSLFFKSFYLYTSQSIVIFNVISWCNWLAFLMLIIVKPIFLELLIMIRTS